MHPAIGRAAEGLQGPEKSSNSWQLKTVKLGLYVVCYGLFFNIQLLFS
jgi:hypothetical protein